MDNRFNLMDDSPVSWRARVWYMIAVLAALTALLTAYTGDAMCFVWCILAGLDWKIADDLITKEKENKHGD